MRLNKGEVSYNSSEALKIHKHDNSGPCLRLSFLNLEVNILPLDSKKGFSKNRGLHGCYWACSCVVSILRHDLVSEVWKKFICLYVDLCSKNACDLQALNCKYTALLSIWQPSTYFNDGGSLAKAVVMRLCCFSKPNTKDSGNLCSDYR